MRKSLKVLKGFTLLELIIVAAIFGIIMAGVIQFITPVSDVYNSTTLRDNQRSTQNSMLKYLTESTKHATRIMIIENDSVQAIDTAKDVFFSQALYYDYDFDGDGSINDVKRYITGDYVCSEDSTCPNIASGDTSCILHTKAKYELQAAEYTKDDIEVIEINRTNDAGKFYRLKAGTSSAYQALSGVTETPLNAKVVHDVRIVRVAPKYSEDNLGGFTVQISATYTRGNTVSDIVSSDSVGFDNLSKLVKDQTYSVTIGSSESDPGTNHSLKRWVTAPNDISSFMYCGPGATPTDPTTYIRMGLIETPTNYNTKVNAYTYADGNITLLATSNGISDVDGNIEAPYTDGNTYICFTTK